jgi:hypothetical protein
MDIDNENKYKDALERAKNIYSASESKDILITLETIFPELKKSQDERIRKELTEFLKKASGGFLDTTTHCKTFGKWLAWLEKQEQSSAKTCNGRQNTAWSEKDEKMYRGIHNLIYATPYCNSRQEFSD